MEQPVTPVPAGWHPDPRTPGVWRWWDGYRWTEHVQPMQAVQPAQAPNAQPWQPAKATTTADGVPLADPGRRMLARLVDQLVTSLVLAVVLLPWERRFLHVMAVTFGQNRDPGAPIPNLFEPLPALYELLVAAAVAGVVVTAVYTIGFTALRAATPGKMLLGLRIRPWQAEGRLTWGQAVKRWLTGDLATALTSFYLAVDLVWVFIDPRRQALHDKWPDTVVVTTRP